MNEIDIYFDRKWFQLYSLREKFELRNVNFKCKYGSVEYWFMCRPIEIKNIKYPYIDIVTPYAFSGPLYQFNDISNKKLLVKEFDDYFSKFCINNNIVSEYVQFNPWITDINLMKEYYDVEFRDKIVGIDLSKNDLLYDEFNARRRRAIRNAEKNNVEFGIDYEGKMIDEFLRLYNYTIDKYEVIDYYKFDKKFIMSLFEEIKGNIYIAYCMYKGQYSSICIVLTSNNYAHYYLASHDPNLKHSNSGSLLIYKIAEKEKLEGRKIFILGGADGNLLEFKQTFTHDCYYDYYIGKKIRNMIIYNDLVKENGNYDSNYFPLYRANNTTQYISSWSTD